jgi:hypothetical protein
MNTSDLTYEDICTMLDWYYAINSRHLYHKDNKLALKLKKIRDQFVIKIKR